MLTVVVDTNLFLQCKPLQDINWLELDPGGVRVVVPMTVVKELDKAKSDGNGRRARRARLVTPLFRTGRLARDPRIPIANRTGCTWEFGSGELLWHEQLDRDLPDHRLLAEARHIAKLNPEAILLSGDMSVLVLAQRLGLRNMELPENWALPAEPDGRDKIIQDLRSELTAERSQRPDITIVSADSLLSSAEGVRFDFYREPSKAELDSLVDQAKALHPLAEVVRKPSEQDEILVAVGDAVRVDPKHVDFTEYRDKYAKWTKRLRSVLTTLPLYWEVSERSVTLTLTLRNQGSSPAFGVVFEYEVHGGALLLPIDAEDRKAILSPPSLPKPPKAPAPLRRRNAYLDSIPVNPMPSFDVGEDRSRRHPYTFYAEDHYREPARRHVWECEEFRHEKEESFEVGILLPARAEGACALSCAISARNTKAMEAPFTLRFSGNELDPLPRLTEALRPEKQKVTLRLSTNQVDLQQPWRPR